MRCTRSMSHGVRVVVDTGGLIFNYRASSLAVALRFQRNMTRDCPGFSVGIDHEDTTDLKPIPCEQLWA